MKLKIVITGRVDSIGSDDVTRDDLVCVTFESEVEFIPMKKNVKLVGKNFNTINRIDIASDCDVRKFTWDA